MPTKPFRFFGKFFSFTLFVCPDFFDTLIHSYLFVLLLFSFFIVALCDTTFCRIKRKLVAAHALATGPKRVGQVAYSTSDAGQAALKEAKGNEGLEAFDRKLNGPSP